MDTYWWMGFRTTPDQLELDQHTLFEIGAEGTEEADPAGPGTAAGDVFLKGYFSDPLAFRTALDRFQDRRELSGCEAPREDWDQSWRDRQTPVEVTPSLAVVPPWVDPGREWAHIIRLEAKMAFGTGSHESTRIAALLLERVPVAGRTVLDIGTGTGILALYAARLGASEVLALDIDPVVGPCLRENLQLNPPPPSCRFRTLIGPLAAVAGETRFHLVVCNMIRTELWPFRDALHGLLHPGGYFLVSGQRLEDKEHFLAWQAGVPFRIAEEVSLEGWWGFAGRASPQAVPAG